MVTDRRADPQSIGSRPAGPLSTKHQAPGTGQSVSCSTVLIVDPTREPPGCLGPRCRPTTSRGPWSRADGTRAS